MIVKNGLALAFALAIHGAPASGERVLVFAAASLQTALDDIATAFAETTDVEVVVSYGSSAALARQIGAGAPAEIFISANAQWMDWLEGTIQFPEGSPRVLVSNRLVLIAPGSGVDEQFPIATEADFGEGRIAMGLVDAVPAGIYGREALVSLGLWDVLRPRVVEVDNVRVALALVSRGDVGRGITYATDARAEPSVRVVGQFARDAHSPIIYPSALVDATPTPEASAFHAFLHGNDGQRIFFEAGFLMPEAAE